MTPPDDPWAHLRRATSARIALGRTGDALPTRRVLEFQLAHAQARDAVHADFDTGRLIGDLADLGPVIVRSEAPDRATYLQRPDLGRRLERADRTCLPQTARDAALVIADGLSARAVETQAAPLCRLLREGTPWSWAPPVIACQARVALGDAVAAALGARLVVVLIGERPGLSASDSMGAYVTFAPVPGTTRDADRNCISNIRPGGMPLEDAAHRIRAIMALAFHLRRTGTLLKEDDALALAAPSA